MDELAVFLKAKLGETLFQIILHGFDIVVCNLLDILDFLSLCRSENFR